MRNLGIALCLAWISVGLDLLWLPSSQLDAEISISRDFIESMQTSALKDSPAMQEGIEQSKRLLTNQSRRGIFLWIAWSALLLMIGYGLWTAYAAFHGRSYAIDCVLMGCLLFLARQAIFHRTPYEMLFRSPEKLQFLLGSEHYPIALSIIWYHYVVATFFFVVAILSSIQLLRRWSNKSQPA